MIIIINYGLSLTKVVASRYVNKKLFYFFIFII